MNWTGLTEQNNRQIFLQEYRCLKDSNFLHAAVLAHSLGKLFSWLL